MNRKARAAARRGAEYLDAKLGRGWRRKIRRRQLDLSDSCNCIVGQLNDGHYRPYTFGVSWRSESRLGFDVGPSSGDDYEELTEAWLEVLREKPKAAA